MLRPTQPPFATTASGPPSRTKGSGYGVQGLGFECCFVPGHRQQLQHRVLPCGRGERRWGGRAGQGRRGVLLCAMQVPPAHWQQHGWCVAAGDKVQDPGLHQRHLLEAPVPGLGHVEGQLQHAVWRGEGSVVGLGHDEGQMQHAV